MTKTATVGVVVLVMALGGCATMREHPAETPAAPASGAKLAEIAGPAFDSARARLTDAGRAQVDAVAHTLQQYPDLQVAVDGHTDAHGTTKYNQKLSERRARAVANRLTEQGIAAARLSVHGFGETRPIADNRSPEGRGRNRRVEIVVE
jgi:OOP family OmpA-OmpF porin